MSVITNMSEKLK